MGYEDVQKKYGVLKQYCENNKFTYLMVDPKHGYYTFEELKKKTITEFIRKKFLHWYFYEKDLSTLHVNKVNTWYKQKPDSCKLNKKDFFIQISSMCLKKKCYIRLKKGKHRGTYYICRNNSKRAPKPLKANPHFC